MEKNYSKYASEEMKRWIASIISEEMDELLSAISRRYSALFPESELICFFLPQNDKKQRKQTLQLVMEFLLKHPSENEK